jgi:two-component system, NtrC family, response regulator AtoC
VQPGGVNVLLLGETGVGKEVFATRLHALSPRAGGPLVKLNCAAFTESLLESELFGHERGAFTGADKRKVGLLESADGGMVFLDEVGEMAAGIQAKLLRVLEDRTLRRVGGTEEIAIDVVFIGATNRDLNAEVSAGRFRADLFYRLNGFALTIPPLRERREEILPLARQFAAAAARRMKLPAPPALADEVIPLLTGHRWSGNIRELRNTMDRAVLLSGGGVISAEHLPVDNLRSGVDALEESLARAASASEPPPGLTADEQAERARIIEVLAAEVGNQTRAAEVLGISRRWLTTLMARYRIPRPRKR